MRWVAAGGASRKGKSRAAREGPPREDEGRARKGEGEGGGAVASGRDTYDKLREVRPVHFSATSLIESSVRL